jgi:hypothetical protein
MMCGGVIGVHCENRVKEVEIVCAKIQIVWCIHILAKKPVYFVASVRPTACRAYQFPLYGYSQNLILESFIKIYRKNPNFAIIGKKSGTVHEDLNKSYFCRRHKIAIEAMSSS